MASRQEQNRLLDAVEIIHRYYEDLFRPVAASFSLTTGQLRVLHILHRYGALTVGDLALAASMARTNMSSLCKKLSKAGFLLRHRGESGDDRQVLLELTPEGECAARQAESQLDLASEILRESDLEELTDKLTLLSRELVPQRENLQKRLEKAKNRHLQRATRMLECATRAIWKEKPKKELQHGNDN